jgi:hypothetical protein
VSVERRLTTAAQIILGSLLSVILLSACTRLATPSLTTEEVARITIQSVRVMPNEGIYVTGTSTLPAGECLKTELLANHDSEVWWPRDLCIEMDDSGIWELLVALGRSGAPQQLEQGRQYEIRAWWPGNPEESMTRFNFDLDGPQSLP